MPHSVDLEITLNGYTFEIFLFCVFVYVWEKECMWKCVGGHGYCTMVGAHKLQQLQSSQNI